MIKFNCDFCMESWNPGQGRWTKRIYYLCSCEKQALTAMGRVLGFKEVDEDGKPAETVRGDVNTCGKCPFYIAGSGPHKIEKNPYQT